MTTQQNTSFAFYIAYTNPQRVEYFETVRFQAGSCDKLAGSWSNISVNAPITNNQFSIPLADFTVQGRFTSATSVIGTIEFADPTGSCGGPLSLPWSGHWSANLTPTGEGT